MTKKLLLLIAGLLLLGFMVGCSTSNDSNDNSYVPMNDLVVGDDFNYQTTRNVMIDLTVLTNNDEPVPSIPFEIFDADPTGTVTPNIIAKGSTNAEGRYEYIVSLPTYLQKVYVVGFMRTEEIRITDNSIRKVYGGAISGVRAGETYFAPSRAANFFSYLNGFTFSSSGVPSPMTKDNISAAFLQRVNSTLPESVPLYNSHPDYFNSNIQPNLKLDEPCDVWITFLTEGASYKNAMGFFTYQQGHEPTSVNDITKHFIILPNASFNGSGGGMAAGDKVYLGQFPANTMIGWFIVSNGYISGSSVSSTHPRYYSLPSLNPEVAASKKKHSIMVYDNTEQKLLVGFEDLPRENNSDEDFNDLVFYATANPIEAIDLEHIPPIDTPVDTDHDGVSDTFDDYPQDPELAYDNYTYAPDGWGTLAYEDLWPSKGDYDFNDMVIDYNINQITNSVNKVKKVDMKFSLKAVGARQANGFAVQLPFNSNIITNLSVSKPDLFQLETDGPKAVMRFFNSAFDMIPQQANNFINTEMGQPYFTPVAFEASFKLSTPQLPTTFDYQPPYNPFIYKSDARGHEIHLAGYTPTSKMDTSLFGTMDDATVPNLRYFKTINNLPWAVNVAAKWDYPIERAQVTRAYTKFKNWAQSNGASFPDWYLNKTNYRDENFIYSHSK